MRFCVTAKRNDRRKAKQMTRKMTRKEETPKSTTSRRGRIETNFPPFGVMLFQFMLRSDYLLFAYFLRTQQRFPIYLFETSSPIPQQRTSAS